MSEILLSMKFVKCRKSQVSEHHRKLRSNLSRISEQWNAKARDAREFEMLARVECESLLSLAYLTSKLAFNSCSQTTLSLAYLPARLCIKSGLLSKMQSIFGSPKNQRFLILSTACCKKSLSYFLIKFFFNGLYKI